MTDTPHRDAARKMPDALSSPVIDTFGPGMTAFIDTLGPKPGDTSWMTALGPDTYAPGALSTIADTVLGMKNFDGLGIKEFGLAPGAGPGMTAFIDTLGPKPGDTSWMTALGPDTYGALADIGRKALGDSTALADIGRNAFGPDAFGGTSTLGDLGPKNYGAGLGSFLDSTALKSVEDRIGAPWIKHLGGGGTYGSLLDDALSPTSLVEEISPSHETVDVPKLSVSTLPVATNPLAPGYGNSDFFETVVDFTKWPLAARDLVAVLVTVSFLPVVLLFHLQGFDSALPAVEIVVALVTALVLRDRK